MSSNIVFLVPLLGIVGLIVMAVKSAWSVNKDAGDANMERTGWLHGCRRHSLLKAEWKNIKLLCCGSGHTPWLERHNYKRINGQEIHSHWLIAVAFIIGAVFSATAGYIVCRWPPKPMYAPLRQRVPVWLMRLKYRSEPGTVMGLGVAGLAVFGFGRPFIVFYQMFAKDGIDAHGMQRYRSAYRLLARRRIIALLPVLAVVSILKNCRCWRWHSR